MLNRVVLQTPRRAVSFGPFSPVHNWLKNVYSSWTTPSIKSVRLYTGISTQPTDAQQPYAKALSFTQSMPTFTPASYTAFLTKFNLLFTRLYTLSTPPIITKMK